MVSLIELKNVVVMIHIICTLIIPGTQLINLICTYNKSLYFFLLTRFLANSFESYGTLPPYTKATGQVVRSRSILSKSMYSSHTQRLFIFYPIKPYRSQVFVVLISIFQYLLDKNATEFQNAVSFCT